MLQNKKISIEHLIIQRAKNQRTDVQTVSIDAYTSNNNQFKWLMCFPINDKTKYFCLWYKMFIDDFNQTCTEFVQANYFFSLRFAH